jgi:hypothetical protein
MNIVYVNKDFIGVKVNKDVEEIVDWFVKMMGKLMLILILFQVN